MTIERVSEILVAVVRDGLYDYTQFGDGTRFTKVQVTGKLYAAIASEVREVGSGGLAMQIVEDSNAFAAIQTRGGSDLRHFNKSVVFTHGLVGPRLLLKAHPHV